MRSVGRAADLDLIVLRAHPTSQIAGSVIVAFGFGGMDVHQPQRRGPDRIDWFRLG
jgi:hypothetical protein